MERQKRYLERLEFIKSLKDGWEGEDSVAITKDALSFAKTDLDKIYTICKDKNDFRVLEQCCITPGPRGTIDLEWMTDNYYINRFCGGELQGSIFCSDKKHTPSKNGWFFNCPISTIFCIFDDIQSKRSFKVETKLDEKFFHTTKEDIIKIHNDLIDSYGGTKNVLNMSGLDSAIGTSIYCSYVNEYQKRACKLLRSLLQNHPFSDGNKRTGFASFAAYVYLYGIKITTPPPLCASIIGEMVSKSNYPDSIIGVFDYVSYIPKKKCSLYEAYEKIKNHFDVTFKDLAGETWR